MSTAWRKLKLLDSAAFIPPCEAFKCKWVVRCELKPIACESFYRWVGSGRKTDKPEMRMPTRAYYKMIYNEEE